MSADIQSNSEHPAEEQPISDKSVWRGLPALWGVALPFGIGAGLFGHWLGNKSQKDLANLLDSSLTPAAILMSAAWVAIALAHAMHPAERRRARTDNLLFTAFAFSATAVAGIALSLAHGSAHEHLPAPDAIGETAAGLMGLTLGGILQLTFRALLFVVPRDDEDADATDDATAGRS